MADYTPPVGDIALGYTERAERVCGTNHFAAMAEFDRWLAAHDAEVAARALEAAADDVARIDRVNPYRTGAGQ